MLSMQPETSSSFAPALEFTGGSTIKSEDESAIYLPSLIANNLQAELSEAAAPVVDNDNVGSVATIVGQQVNIPSLTSILLLHPDSPTQKYSL